MNIANPGNIVPFYTNKRWQRHRLIGQQHMPYGLQALAARLLPFQIFLSVEALPDIGFFLYNAGNEADSLSLDAGLLEVKENADGGFWVTWKAGMDIDQIPTCGFWYIKISAGEVEYFSEVLHLRDFLDQAIWKLTFANTKDKSNVLYQTGYQQYFHPFPVFNAPLIDRDRETFVDGFGKEVSRFTRTNERLRFEIPDLPDYLLQTIAEFGDIETVTLEEISPSNSFELSGMEFTSRRQGSAFHIGEFSFDVRNAVFSGCQTDFVLAE